MINKIVASAPGKLVLTGEYAVLDGAPAVSAAVQLSATVTLETPAAANHQLQIVNTGGRFSFALNSAGELDWQTDPDEYGALPEAVFAAMAEQGQLTALLAAINTNSMLITVDSRQFFTVDTFGKQHKKGIGSSAVIATVLTAALQTLAGNEPDVDVALQAHSRFQGKQGSGIDVLTSWFGGLVFMQAGQVINIGWPQGLYVLPVVTGEPASTTSRLRKLERFRRDQPEHAADVMRSLTQTAEQCAALWQQGDGAELITAIGAFAKALQGLDDAAGLDVWSAPHQALKKLADESQVIYKPSGAGGGDCGVAFALDKDALTGFSARANAAGFDAAALRWCSSGLQVTIQ